MHRGSTEEIGWNCTPASPAPEEDKNMASIPNHAAEGLQELAADCSSMHV